MEATIKLTLPLRCEASWTDYKTTRKIASGKSEPLNIDDRDEAVGKNTSNRLLGLKSSKLTHENGAMSARFYQLRTRF